MNIEFQKYILIYDILTTIVNNVNLNYISIHLNIMYV